MCDQLIAAKGQRQAQSRRKEEDIVVSSISRPYFEIEYWFWSSIIAPHWPCAVVRLSTQTRAAFQLSASRAAVHLGSVTGCEVA